MMEQTKKIVEALRNAEFKVFQQVHDLNELWIRGFGDIHVMEDTTTMKIKLADNADPVTLVRVGAILSEFGEVEFDDK